MAKINPLWMVGIDPKSDGLAKAREHGLKTTDTGIDGLLAHVGKDHVRIAFDATSAYVHKENARKLRELGVVVIDLTPAAIGPYCVPPVNLANHAGRREMNVNMVSCGGQATIPMVAAHSRVEIRRPRHSQEHRRIHAHDGQWHRKSRRCEARQGHQHSEPSRTPAHHARHGALPDGDDAQSARDHRVRARDACRSAEVRAGYQLKNGPIFDGNRVSVYLEVAGLGDYLPKYAGNLDIMTAAALRTGEMLADEIARGAYN
jgi:acetaldehyde/propanal dehydrogenase